MTKDREDIRMYKGQNLFVLAGNGPYTNRGCEAIVRGTVEILRRHFDDPRFLLVSGFSGTAQYLDQCRKEPDPAITHQRNHFIFGPGRFRNPAWWAQTFLTRALPAAGQSVIWREMIPYLAKARAVLSVGGDNYSIDYGVPKLFMGLNDVILRSGKEPVLWGASVGPFDKIPDLEKSVIENLSKVIIFAREPATIEYLNSRGLKSNVYRVADPAFVMEPVSPKDGFSVEAGAVGINLSPLIAQSITDGDVVAWTRRAAEMVECVAKRVKRPIYLIPHETTAHTDDHRFLKDVHSLLNDRGVPTVLVPPVFSAAELKWIISRMSAFAGARTHSTIAALSSGVPTLSIGYSLKARGLNRDIFGNLDYCVLADKKLDPEAFGERMEDILRQSNSISRHIRGELPRIVALAMEGGRLLKEVVIDGKG